MEHQHQVKHRHDAVHVAPEVVGEAAQQGDDDHGQQQVECPLAHRLGRFAQAGEQPVGADLGQAPGEADQGFDQGKGFFDSPVRGAENDGKDAGPLVQAVDAIHAAERRFEPGRAGRQNHDQRHQSHRQNAAEVKPVLAGDPQRAGAFRESRGQEGVQPGSAEQGQKTGKRGGGRGVHRRSPFEGWGRSGRPSRARLRYYACVFLNRS